ncbi:MAG: polyprenyl diphosphate synthase [Burkholderiales bacterium]
MPRHVAIIMDGNGRWAKKRYLPRVAGHRRGVETVREITKSCIDLKIEFLTLFAFSSENWRRPQEEVSVLQQLFMMALEQEIDKLDRNRIRLRIIGNLDPFGARIRELAQRAEEQTAHHNRLTLTIAANYGGRWDMLQAVNKLVRESPRDIQEITEESLAPLLSLNYAPEPDLFIRTGGEQRISNFLLWHLAYTELYFTPKLWPDFDRESLNEAIDWFQTRERRFGRTSEQLESRGEMAEAAANSESTGRG